MCILKQANSNTCIPLHSCICIPAHVCTSFHAHVVPEYRLNALEKKSSLLALLATLVELPPQFPMSAMKGLIYGTPGAALTQKNPVVKCMDLQSIRGNGALLHLQGDGSSSDADCLEERRLTAIHPWPTPQCSPVTSVTFVNVQL